MDSRSRSEKKDDDMRTEEYLPIWKVIGAYLLVMAIISVVIYKVF